MKVRFKACVSGNGFLIKPGQEIESSDFFSEKEVTRYLSDGVCVPVKIKPENAKRIKAEK